MTARHSTGVAEPVPAVDDDLFRDLGLTIRSAWIAGINPTDIATAVAASEPMQRLRAAWTTEANQERDEAQEELEDHVAAGVGQEQVAAFLAWKRDGGAAAVQQSGRSRSEIGALTAEVERLRAAVPDLPDVGTPIRHASGALEVPVNPGDWTTSRHYDNRGHAAEAAACALTALRQFDREAEERAADTSDDEICMSRGPRIGDDGAPYCKQPTGHDGHHAPAPEDGWDRNVVWSDLTAHRARTNGEGTRG